MPGEIKVGDVVLLKSGGQPMTVWQVRADGVLDCVWHDKEGRPQRDSYAEAEMRKYG